jgi:HK97 family phage major capsid protein
MSEHATALVEERQKSWHAAKEILDRCVEEKRSRTAEEDVMFLRANEDMDRIGREIDDIVDQERRTREIETAREAVEGLVRPEGDDGADKRQADAAERWFRGDSTASNDPERRGGFVVSTAAAARQARLIREGADAKELRAVITDGGASGGSLWVPTTFATELYQYMEASSAVRRISRVITTASGESMAFPRVTTHGTGSQVSGQGTTVAGAEAVLGRMILDAYKYGQLVQVSPEMIDDNVVDIIGFVAENAGRALGRVTDTDHAVGSGSAKPNGVITAATGSIATGGSLIEATLELLINLQYSIVDEYDLNASWVMNRSTGGTVRKIRADGGGTIGPFVWEPSSIVGQPDTLLGRPVYFDGNVATQGSNAKTVAYGDFNSYYIRDSGSVRFERSDEWDFADDLVTFKAVLRTDSDLIDTNAIKILKQNVT